MLHLPWADSALLCQLLVRSLGRLVGRLLRLSKPRKAGMAWAFVCWLWMSGMDGLLLWKTCIVRGPRNVQAELPRILRNHEGPCNGMSHRLLPTYTKGFPILWMEISEITQETI